MKATADVKVLIVEDDPFFLRVLHKRITSEGYQVMTAADGREGMKAIVAFEPDLVISDWMMPEVDGLELCQSVKTGLRDAAPYFILLTAKGEISDKLLGLQTGADDYLVKPCEPAEILARVKAGLRQVLVTRELKQALARLEEAQGQLATSQAEVRKITLHQVHMARHAVFGRGKCERPWRQCRSQIGASERHVRRRVDQAS